MPFFRKHAKDTPLDGASAEQLACAYLQRQGLKLVAKNFRIRQGEIDLIMTHNATLVFVEVRFRKCQDFGGAGGSITSAKYQRVAQAAMAYSQHHDIGESVAQRIDAVLISPQPDCKNKYQIDWIKNISP